ncbi:MAG: CoA transferase [Chloroflexi bacterium]|nr:CoA transferase [Chloroflexota bacterium]MCI0780264.1 CoA transferase [Chloroflexota bacterium]MCI0784699.1 CoA transferase [Chloroflexota bacterium]MCI0793124.1 CoA transferase [Chloroflexota bacterium]MCI0797941.1 CoA transferase [Chloroflexota bacterium]
MSELPLDGIRVVDLSWIIAGPTATRILAAMGAEVIKVGSARRPDPSTRGPAFQVYNQSKLYCALNISTPKGLELAKQLLAVSDVVIENFAVGVIERLGLSYEVISAKRPDIIMVSSSGTGHSGPHKDYVAYGSLLQHYTGWNSISGYPHSEPVRGGLWADPWVGMELAMVTVAALNGRAVTGRGQYIDFSMAEALTASIPEAILDYQMNHRVREPMGNRDDWYAPHGLYHCAGEDRWVAIAVTNDEEWNSLCRLIQRLDLAADPRFVNAEGRRKYHDQLDVAITEWTIRHQDHEAMRLLQEAGVSSGPSLDISRVFNEPQLRDVGYFTRLETSDGELRDLPGLPWRFEGEQKPLLTEAPVLGQHNAYVYQELLGLSEPEVNRLVEEQIIY